MNGSPSTRPRNCSAIGSCVALAAADPRGLEAAGVTLLPHLQPIASCHAVAPQMPRSLATWPYPNISERGHSVKLHMVFAGAVVAALACPLAAQAQGIPGGIAHGANEGAQAAGPVGAVVGGVVGGVFGGVRGLFGIQTTYAAYPVEERPIYRTHRHYRHHTYRRVRHRPVS